MELSFTAALPTSRTCVAFDGEGAAKISLDTSAEEIAAVLALILKMRGLALKVTVEVAE